MKIKFGTTRYTILTKKYAFKIPSLYGIKHFLLGLLANKQEQDFSKLNCDRLCPILFYIPYLIIIMPRVKSMNINEFNKFKYLEFINLENGYIIPVENKLDSFGWLDEKIVAIDYGS